MTEMTQRGGMGSSNVQIHTLNTGLSYSDVRDIAKDLFDANFRDLINVARDTASMRAAEMRDAILDELQRQKTTLDGFKEPEKQFALIDAQKGFALSGSQELRDALVRAVLALSREKENSLRSIVFGEAIRTLPLLTRSQMGLLVICFVVRMVLYGAKDFSDLDTYLHRTTAPFWPESKPSSTDFVHLDYTRCASVQVTEGGFGWIMRQSYTRVFSRSTTRDHLTKLLAERGVPASCIKPIPENPDQFTFLPLNLDELNKLAKVTGWSEQQEKSAIGIWNSFIMTDDDIRRLVADGGQSIRRLMDIWDTTELKSLKLSSVGIAVAHSCVSSVVAGFPDISVWLQNS